MKYNAVRSDRHSDATLAVKIRQRRRRYHPPRKSEVTKRRLTVFRDMARLTAAANLQTNLAEIVRGNFGIKS